MQPIHTFAHAVCYLMSIMAIQSRLKGRSVDRMQTEPVRMRVAYGFEATLSMRCEQFFSILIYVSFSWTHFLAQPSNFTMPFLTEEVKRMKLIC